jgi:predicted MFS family arabinose efflux permease
MRPDGTVGIAGRLLRALADLAVRRQHLDIRIGSLLWFVFGIAGVAGGMSAGRLVDYLGGRAVLKAFLTIQVVASALCLQPLTALIVPAAGLAGFVAVGATTVVLLLVQEKAGSDATLIWRAARQRTRSFKL